MDSSEEKKFSGLENNIISTLSYYQLLGRPLSLYELYRHLMDKDKSGDDLDLPRLKKAADSLCLQGVVSKRRGFYFLDSEDSEPFQNRIREDKTMVEKWILARKRAGFLRFIPYIRAVFISGSLAVGNVHSKSDIDVLVVSARDRIWTTRFLLHLVLAVVGWRRKGSKVKDMVCLNHFLTVDSLKIPFANVYNAQTYSHLLALVDFDGLLSKFYHVNTWLKDYLFHQANLFTKNKNPLFKNRGLVQRSQEWIWEFFGGAWLESFLAWLQQKKITFSRRKKNIEERIYTTEGQLAFHPRKQQREIVQGYRRNLKKFNLGN